MNIAMTDMSDYIVFADESGDHDLSQVNVNFPLFCLSLCVVEKSDYVQKIVPAFQTFKFEIWGHDAVVLHEHEIRKTLGEFGFLRTDKGLRESFYSRLNQLMNDSPMYIFASVIKKDQLKRRYAHPDNPYDIALLFCLERLLNFLMSKGEIGKKISVLFESRGKKEDRDLEVSFRRICDNDGNWGYKSPDFRRLEFDPVFVPKSINSTGLQLADLTARPIALNCLRPEQSNRAYDIIAPKLVQKVFP